MTDTPIDWSQKECEEQLDSLINIEVVRGWTRTNGRYVVGYYTLNDEVNDEQPKPCEVVLSFPQLRSFLVGVDAGMGWVSTVARRVKEGRA